MAGTDFATKGLGLYQQGLGIYQQQQDRERQQQQIAKQEARQAQLDAANKAAAGFIEQARAKAPNPEQWQPDDNVMFQAGAARSRELARAGLFDELAQNEVALEKQRIRARGSALQSWRLKRDPKALIAQAYSTIPDGGTVQDVQPLDGGKRVKVKFSTGVEQEIDPEQLAGALEATLIEPGRYAELSVKRNMEAALIEARKEAELAQIKARGDATKDAVEARGKYQLEVKDKDAAGRKAVAETRAAADIKEAQIRAADKAGGGGGGTSLRVRSTTVDAAGNRIHEMSDGTRINVGKDKAFQSMVRAEISALEKTRQGMRMKPDELEAEAIARITRRAGKTVPMQSDAPPPRSQGLGSGISPARDAEAGRLMIQSEMGGDINRAKAELAQMREGIARAPNGDGKAMLMSQAARLEAGIRALESGQPGGRPQLPVLGNFKIGAPVPSGPAPTLDSLYKTR